MTNEVTRRPSKCTPRAQYVTKIAPNPCLSRYKSHHRIYLVPSLTFPLVPHYFADKTSRSYSDSSYGKPIGSLKH